MKYPMNYPKIINLDSMLDHLREYARLKFNTVKRKDMRTW